MFDTGLPFGCQSANDEAGRGAQISGAHGGALQGGNTADDGGVAFDADVCAQTRQLGGVHEAVFKDGLGDDGRAVGDRQQRRQRLLQVRREAGIALRLDVHGAEAAVAAHVDDVVLAGHVHAHLHATIRWSISPDVTNKSPFRNLLVPNTSITISKKWEF